MTGTLAQLVEIRSQLAEEVCRYCTRLIDKLDHTPWFRERRNVRASDVAVPVRVLKESTRPEPSRFEHGRAEDDAAKLREREPSRDYVDPEIAALYEEATLEKRKEEVPWLQERAQVRRAIVLGGPGSGKTFLTQTTGLGLAGAVLDAVREKRTGLDAVLLPIHLTLASFARPDLPSGPAAAVLELLRDEWSPAPCFLSWFEQRLRSASTWLLLDALDEVREDRRPALTARLRAIDSQGWQTRLLLTCRPANWARELIPWSDLTEYELAPLNPLEIRQFVQRWFASDRARSDTLVQTVDHSYPLAHAARTPVIATFLCLAHEEAGVTTSTRRTELYAHVVRGLARRAWKEKPLAKMDPHVDDVVRFLVCLAQPLFERHPTGNLFTHTEITTELEGSKRLPIPLSALEARRAGQPMPPPEAWPTLLRDELLGAGIVIGAGLREGTETQFSFAHRSLLEYLVARNLHSVISDKARGWRSIERVVDKKSWHPAWQETVVFLAGLMDNPVPLLALLADASKDDMTRQRLCLASRCLPELSVKGCELYQRALNWRNNVAKKSSDESNMPDIARDVLQLWWTNAERFTPFRHATNILPLTGAAGACELVPELLRRSQAASAATRALAAQALGGLGAVAATEPLLNRLTDCLRDPEGEVRRWAAKALGGVGAAAATEPLLNRLTDCLRDAKWIVRINAAEALGRLGAAAATGPVVSRLTDCLRDPERSVRSAAAEALGGLGAAAATELVLSRLTDRLRDPDKNVRSGAAEALGRLGAAAATEPVLSRLTDWLRDPDENVRSGAAEALGRLGVAAVREPVLSRLTDCLRDLEENVRSGAAEALGRLGGAAAREPVLSRLTDCLRDPEEDVRSSAAEALGRLGGAAATEPVLSRLTDCLRDLDENVRYEAAWAFYGLGAAAATEPVLSRLTEYLRDPEEDVRSSAAEALGQLGGAAATEPVLRRLTDCLRDPEKDVRYEAACAFCRLGAAAATEPVLSRLTDCLRDPELTVRRSAASALGALGAAAAKEPVLSRLTDCLHDPEWSVRGNAAEALGRLGVAAAREPVLRRLIEGLGNFDWDLHGRATGALDQFLRSGVRWFAGRQGALVVCTVANLSGEAEPPRP